MGAKEKTSTDARMHTKTDATAADGSEMLAPKSSRRRRAVCELAGPVLCGDSVVFSEAGAPCISTELILIVLVGVVNRLMDRWLARGDCGSNSGTAIPLMKVYAKAESSSNQSR